MKFRSVKKHLKKQLRALECGASDKAGCEIACCIDCTDICGRVCRHAYQFKLNYTTDCRHLHVREALQLVARLQKIRKDSKR